MTIYKNHKPSIGFIIYIALVFACGRAEAFSLDDIWCNPSIHKCLKMVSGEKPKARNKLDAFEEAIKAVPEIKSCTYITQGTAIRTINNMQKAVLLSKTQTNLQRAAESAKIAKTLYQDLQKESNAQAVKYVINRAKLTFFFDLNDLYQTKKLTPEKVENAINDAKKLQTYAESDTWLKIKSSLHIILYGVPLSMDKPYKEIPQYLDENPNVTLTADPHLLKVDAQLGDDLFSFVNDSRPVQCYENLNNLSDKWHKLINE